MTANPILLQKKYARIIELFAKKEELSLDEALNFFYRSATYRLISEGVSDLHCMSMRIWQRNLLWSMRENVKALLKYERGRKRKFGRKIGWRI